MESAANAIAIYGQIKDPLDFVEKIGEAFAKSQMFGCKSRDQGKVLAMACITSGADPLSLVQRYHLIDGNLSMRADAMLAGFHERGGKHRIVFRDSDMASVELTYEDQKNIFSLSWIEAQEEPWTKNKKGEIKTNYATPRARMQMMWARVVSDGVRAVCPEVTSGTYTPEELRDLPDAIEPQEIEEAEVIHSEVANSAPSQPTEPKETESVKDDLLCFCTSDECERLTALFKENGIEGEMLTKILSRRNVEAISSLTGPQAQELIASLMKARQATQKEAAADDTAFSESLHGQVKPDEVAAIKELIGTAMQSAPNLITDISERLNKSGLSKISDLTIGEARTLRKAIETTTMEAFFDSEIRGIVPF
tara:strand:- start:12 stop:1109 length:1098 start_codon:yes stop_codon:yes gene_type:complete